ncbi:hypothetical protein NPX13_g6110 [Xylaria arbuscula]|uniref:SET domain-containing protein n=1 Tax=Xylaria arbuscula TaxID=114810 RepID=A0A9W8ND22_9PEZI|nr:hypothetical protein NPX13_g6110 [Xylaria arbuscula]
MSDISASFDDEWPFEVRSAGDKGMGAFATRDIDPGEVVIVQFSPILINYTGDDARDCFEMVQIYEALTQDLKEGWRSLAISTDRRSAAKYRRIFSSLQPNGRYFSEEQQELYTTLSLQLDVNIFGTCTSLVALFIDVSRFNHSCDPSLWYGDDSVPSRWVGRARRRIRKGEEICISYVPTHDMLDKRQKAIREWGFTCLCAKCTGQVDEYTLALQEARDRLNTVESDESEPPPVFPDSMREMEQHYVRRCILLQEVSTAIASGGKDYEQTRKALVFASMDCAEFYTGYYQVAERAKVLERMVIYLQLRLEYLEQAITIAQDIWPETHHVLNFLAFDQEVTEKKLQKWQRPGAVNELGLTDLDQGIV